MPHPDSRQRLTPTQFKALAKYKGWKFKMLAERWGVTPEWVSQVSRDPMRDLRYDDALLGLPNLHRLARDMKARERQLDAAVARTAPSRDREARRRPTPGYRYRGYLTTGVVVTASTEVGSMAEEGMRGVVFQILDDRKQETYGVIFETGMWDWFPPDYVDLYLTSTGLVCRRTERYRYVDERTLQEDFHAGRFTFWPEAEQESGTGSRLA
ncbi:MAG TPA: hypothetical protein VIM12_13480 [Noviherbaspirillum sp.]|jgi:hypothetical protein|uniref:hypothetical protein n=1 Tax=Noviherbaspirillum sp. TaxID=1926288 RepID=UPI002F94199E